MAPPLVALGIQPVQQPDILGNYSKLVSLRGAQQAQQIQQQLAPLQIQQQQQENQQRQMQIQGQQAMMKAAQDPAIGWDKPGAYDRFIATAQKNGAPPQMLLPMQESVAKLKETLASTDKTTLANQIAQNEMRRGKLLSIIAIKDPIAQQSAWQNEVNAEIQAGNIQPGQIPLKYPTNDGAQHIADQLAQGNVLADEAIKRQEAQTRQMQAETASKRLTAELPGGPLYAPTVAGASAQARVQAEGTPEALAAEGRRAAVRAQAEVPAAVSKALQIQQATQKLLEGDALDQAAERYSQTGQMPSGMRGPAIATQIMRRSAELHPTQSLAANSAEFQANKASFENVTKRLDTLQAFESAAGKNLDMANSLLSKLPDTGIPWLNTPVRLLNEKMVGNEWMPAVRAAREVANREIARVTSNPALTGELTDTARKEVRDFSPDNATIPQIRRVIGVLKTDMANVEGSLGAQKSDIGRRLGMGAAPQSAPRPNGIPTGATGKAKGSDGKWHFHDAKGNDLGVAQ